MIVLGLTGSIGMGKSTAAEQFKRMGIRVFDADKEVHKLMAPEGEAFSMVKKKFPETVAAGKIDRKKLGGIVFANKSKLKILENVLHPLVRKKELEFLRKCRITRQKITVLDIPLLFETGADNLCDYIVVVVAPSYIQSIRVEKRSNIKGKKFVQINQLQMPTGEKIKRADFVIHTGLDKRFIIKQTRQIINAVKR